MLIIKYTIVNVKKFRKFKVYYEEKGLVFQKKKAIKIPIHLAFKKKTIFISKKVGTNNSDKTQRRNNNIRKT